MTVIVFVILKGIARRSSTVRPEIPRLDLFDFRMKRVTVTREPNMHDCSDMHKDFRRTRRTPPSEIGEENKHDENTINHFFNIFLS